MTGLNGQKILVGYSGVLTLAVVVALLSGFTGEGGSTRFDTITVQRINIAEPDGKIRMVLSNNRRFPGLIIHGREYPHEGRKADATAGVLFFDGDATESGGLTFGGKKDAQGKISRWGHLSFDRYDQDQMFTISAEDNGTSFGSSIQMLELPSWPIQEYLDLIDRIQHLPPEQQQAALDEFWKTHPKGNTRTVLSSATHPTTPGSNYNGLQLQDTSGKDRARLQVDGAGNPSLEFLDAAGNVTHRYPQN